MDKIKKILVADTPSSIEIVHPILHSQFDLVLTHSVTNAMQKLELDIDIVLCGLHFDESRMFELLRYIKEDKTRAQIPFISLNVKNSVLPPSVVHIAAKAVIAMGGDGFIDLCRWRDVLGDDRAFARFRAHLHLL